jgi:hypothetical protein
MRGKQWHYGGTEARPTVEVRPNDLPETDFFVARASLPA